jgi:hypothetical protein
MVWRHRSTSPLRQSRAAASSPHLVRAPVRLVINKLATSPASLSPDPSPLLSPLCTSQRAPRRSLSPSSSRSCSQPSRVRRGARRRARRCLITLRPLPRLPFCYLLEPPSGSPYASPFLPGHTGRSPSSTPHGRFYPGVALTIDLTIAQVRACMSEA